MDWILKSSDWIRREREVPNLLRGLFPYQEVPKIVFDFSDVPLEPAEDIWITDTTFRDGQQARPPYSVKQITDIFTLLHRLGGPRGVIRQSEFFLYSEKDKKAVRKCQELGFKYPQITGWIRAVAGDFALVKQMDLKETGILTSASDYHIYLKLKKDRRQAMEDYLAIVKSALEARIIPRCHLEDITRADFYGFVLPFVQKLMELSKKAKIPIKVRACDTLGYGVPYPQAALPRSVPKLIYKLVHEGGVPPAQLEWHGHNDFHKVLVNGTVAWLYGASAINGTLLGFGERTGNPPVEGLIIDYISLKGKTDGIDTAAITKIAEYFRKEIGAEISPHYPFVGSEFNTTHAGIHADGIIKNEEIYNIFNTTKILKRPLGVSITDKSGTAGIVFWINDHLKLKGKKRLDKRHPGVLKIYKWVEEQYRHKRTTAISPEEMKEQIKKHLPEYMVSEFERLEKKAEDLVRHLIEKLAGDPTIKSMQPKQAEPILQKLSQEHPYIQYIYIVDKEGKLITRNIVQPQDRKVFSKIKVGEDFSNRVWFKKAIQSKKTYLSGFYTSRITGELCITVSTPIRGKKQGVLGIDIKFEDLLKME